MNAMATLGEFDKAHLSAIGRQAEVYDAEEGDVFSVTLGWRVCHEAHPHIGGEVIGWADPVDDFLNPCAQDHPDAVFRTILVRWDEGTKPQLSDRVPAGRVRGEGWRPEHSAPPAPLKFLSYDDMISLPDPEWLVDGLIAFETSALLFGKSNSFKSFLAIDIAASVATGTPWHGVKTGGSEFQGAPLEVVYVATEGAHGVAKQRIPGWMEAHGIDHKTRQFLRLYPQEIALDDDKAVDELILSCARNFNAADPDAWSDPSYSCRLIVIDIFGASMMGPETSDETARAWVRNINRIMREVNCAVLTVAHTGWADDTRARMHTHFWGSFDTRLKAEGDKDSMTTVLTVDRHKDADSSGQWGFRLEKVKVPNSNLTTLIPVMSDEVEKTQKRRVSGKPAVALQALSEALADHGRTIAGPNYPTGRVVPLSVWLDMCARHGLTDSDNPDALKKAFQRAKTTLIDKGLVRQFDNHAWPTTAEPEGQKGTVRGQSPTVPCGDGQGHPLIRVSPVPGPSEADNKGQNK